MVVSAWFTGLWGALDNFRSLKCLPMQFIAFSSRQMFHRKKTSFMVKRHQALCVMESKLGQEPKTRLDVLFLLSLLLWRVPPGCKHKRKWEYTFALNRVYTNVWLAVVSGNRARSSWNHDVLPNNVSSRFNCNFADLIEFLRTLFSLICFAFRSCVPLFIVFCPFLQLLSQLKLFTNPAFSVNVLYDRFIDCYWCSCIFWFSITPIK